MFGAVFNEMLFAVLLSALRASEPPPPSPSDAAAANTAAAAGDAAAAAQPALLLPVMPCEIWLCIFEQFECVEVRDLRGGALGDWLPE